MRYSFDRAKQASNLKKHGFDLADAPVVIESGETVTFEDRRFAYGEERFVTLGACRTWGSSAAIWPQRSIFHRLLGP